LRLGLVLGLGVSELGIALFAIADFASKRQKLRRNPVYYLRKMKR